MTTLRGRGRMAFALPLFLFAGCASSGTEPHAMTSSEHEAAAKREEALAREHEKLRDPAETALPIGISSSYVSCPGYSAIACYGAWTSVRSPSERHLSDARWHIEQASQHRAASQALRAAEGSACQNVPEGERDISPFYHREDIVSARPFAEGMGLGGQRTVGAEVVFAALPAMTAEWLQRVVDCHLARNAVIADVQKTMTYCPLAVPHVKATVRSLGSSFAVDITSSDETSVKEIVTRANALTGGAAPRASH